jgi:hypothetical protein
VTQGSSAQGLDELLDGYAGVADERTQEARLQLGMVWNCQRLAGLAGCRSRKWLPRWRTTS